MTRFSSPALAPALAAATLLCALPAADPAVAQTTPAQTTTTPATTAPDTTAPATEGAASEAAEYGPYRYRYGFASDFVAMEMRFTQTAEGVSQRICAQSMADGEAIGDEVCGADGPHPAEMVDGRLVWTAGYLNRLDPASGDLETEFAPGAPTTLRAGDTPFEDAPLVAPD